MTSFTGQRGSGSIGLLILLPIILFTLVLMLDLGRQLLVRSLLAEAVEEVNRQLLSKPDLRQLNILPEDQAQEIWQQVKQDQWLLADIDIKNGAPEGSYFLDREQILAANPAGNAGWDSSNSCCALLTWEFTSSATLSAFEAVAGFGWNSLSFTFRRLLVIPADANPGN